MRKIHKLLPAIALALAASDAAAQVLYEPFNYTPTGTGDTTLLPATAADSEVEVAAPGAYKHYNTQGTFWAKRGTQTVNSMWVESAGSLTPNGIGPMILPDGQGAKMRQASNTGTATATLPLGQLVQGAGSTIYWSGVLQLSSFPSSTAESDAVIGFNNFGAPGDGRPSAVAAGLKIRRSTPTSTTNYQVGVSDWNDIVTWDTGHNFVLGSSVFVVARATFGAGNGIADDVYDLWVNPTSDFGALTAPTATVSLNSTKDITDPGPGFGSTIASLMMDPTSGFGGSRFDEIRVDSTWAGVAPDGNLQYAWSGAGGGNLADATWTAKPGAPAPKPNGVGHVANFGPAVAAGNITTAGETLDTINLNTPNSLTVDGTGLTIATNASAGQIVALQGSHTITAPLTLNNDLAVKTGRLPGLTGGVPTNAPGRVTLASTIGGGTKTISTYGVGTVALGAAGVFNSTDHTLAVRSGTFDLNGFDLNVNKLVLGVGHTNPATDVSVAATAVLAVGNITATGGGIITAGSYDLQSGTIAAVLDGTSGVVKNNQADVTLSGNNIYSGDTVVRGGKLTIAGVPTNTVNAVLHPPVATAGATSTLAITSDANLGPAPLAPSPVITMVTAVGEGGMLQINGSMTLNANRTITANAGESAVSVSTGNTATIPGLITGTGGLDKRGGGTLILTGLANDYAKNTRISGGVLYMSSLSALGASGGDIFVAGGTAGNGPTASLQVDASGGDLTIAEKAIIEGKSSGGGGNATPHLHAVAGNVTFTQPAELNAAGTWFNVQAATGAKLTVGGITNPITGTSPRVLNLRGAGDGEITGDIVNTGADGGGPVAVSKFDGGTWTISGTSTHTGPTNASGGTLVFGKSLTTSSSVTVSNNAKIVLADDSSQNLIINTPAVSISAAGRVDLKNNKLITLTAAGTATEGVYNGLQGEVQRAYNFGSWDGGGLATSMPDALAGIATVGVATGEQIRGLGPTDTDVWAGQTINGASVIAMYTYAGDANLDGQVDAGDYGILDAFIQVEGATGYGNGDFNYDGFIDAADYGTIDNSIQFQGPPIPTSGSAASAGLSGVTAVPEPASLSVLGLTAAGLLSRRRRRHGA